MYNSEMFYRFENTWLENLLLIFVKLARSLFTPHGAIKHTLDLYTYA